jgi:hypothetical protein
MLLTLPNYAAWMRFLIDDTPSGATFVEMLPPPKAINHRPHRLITNSRVRFGRERATVEGYSDVGGKPDTVQIMLNRGHLYVGHMFTDGVTVLDVSNPRQPKPVHSFITAPNTRTHHLQVANDLMLLGNGANIVRMQSYDSARGYFENTLADSLTNRQPFRSVSSRHLAFAAARSASEMPGIGIATGGADGTHLDGFTDTISSSSTCRTP